MFFISFIFSVLLHFIKLKRKCLILSLIMTRCSRVFRKCHYLAGFLFALAYFFKREVFFFCRLSKKICSLLFFLQFQLRSSKDLHFLERCNWFIRHLDDDLLHQSDNGPAVLRFVLCIESKEVSAI